MLIGTMHTGTLGRKKEMTLQLFFLFTGKVKRLVLTAVSNWGFFCHLFLLHPAISANSSLADFNIYFINSHFRISLFEEDFYHVFITLNYSMRADKIT